MNECVYIKPASVRSRIRNVAVCDLVGPYRRPPKEFVEVGRAIGWVTVNGGHERSGLGKKNRTKLPSAQHAIHKTVRVRQELSAAPEWELVESGQQETLAS